MCSPIPQRKSPKPFLFGKRPDTRRKPGTKPFWQSLLRRPIGNTHSKYQSAHQPDKSPVEKNSAHERMGHQARSHRREHDRSRYHQSVGSTLVVSSPHQTHLKKNRSAEPHGSMAQPRSFFPRRNQFRTLSRTIPGAHLQPRHALRRDL